MLRLQNKVALITGAARGIGLATAKLFAQEGAKVFLTDINDESGINATRKIGLPAQYLNLDVSKVDNWKRVSDQILLENDCIDILINNAGITGFLETDGPHDPENFDVESWQKVHSVNLNGVAFGCKTAISLMKKSKSASIVNISSRSGIVGIPAAAAYASSKAAIRNHTKTVALYCAEKAYPIRCNSLHPGAILTPMWDAMLGEGEQKTASIAAVEKDIPLRRMGTANDVAYAALFLASDESKYVTGIELNVDGGILAGSTAAPSQNE